MRRPTRFSSGTLTGVLEGDGITVAFTTTATPESPVGTYVIAPSLSDPNQKLANYNVVSSNGTLTITQAVPVILWATPANIIYGTPLSAAQLNASSDVPGTFVYDSPAGTLLNAGNHTVTTLFHPTSTNYVDGVTVSVTVTVDRAPVAVWLSNLSSTFDGNPKPATVSTTPLGFTVLTTYTGIDGTTYQTSVDPPSGPVGSYAVTATVTDANYTGVANGALRITPFNVNSLIDTTLADFSNGVLEGTYIASNADGEITLKPVFGDEFVGTSLSSDWATTFQGYPLGIPPLSVSGGLLTLDGMGVTTQAGSFGPGSFVEFYGTLGESPYHYAGFSSDRNFSSGPWAMIGTYDTVGVMVIEVSNSSVQKRTAIVADPAKPHLFRINWLATGYFDFYVDGAKVGTSSDAWAADVIVTERICSPALANSTISMLAHHS